VAERRRIIPLTLSMEYTRLPDRLKSSSVSLPARPVGSPKLLLHRVAMQMVSCDRRLSDGFLLRFSNDNVSIFLIFKGSLDWELLRSPALGFS